MPFFIVYILILSFICIRFFRKKDPTLLQLRILHIPSVLFLITSTIYAVVTGMIGSYIITITFFLTTSLITFAYRHVWIVSEFSGSTNSKINETARQVMVTLSKTDTGFVFAHASQTQTALHLAFLGGKYAIIQFRGNWTEKKSVVFKKLLNKKFDIPFPKIVITLK